MKLSGNNRLTKWALFMQLYKFKINYKRGIKMTSTDAISQIPRGLTELPNTILLSEGKKTP